MCRFAIDTTISALRGKLDSNERPDAGLHVGHDRFPTYYGTELTSIAVLRWAIDRLQWHYIQPGKQNQNAFIESFNMSVRMSMRS